MLEVLERPVGLMDAPGADEQVDELIALRAEIDRMEAEAARRLASVVESGAFARLGHASATQFLKYRCGMRGGRAKRLVARATSLASMPLTARLYAEGRLSSDQVGVLIAAHDYEPALFAEAEPALCEAAENLSWVSDLQAAVDYWKLGVDSVRADRIAADRYEHRAAYLSRTFDGMLHLEAWFAAPAADAIETALLGAMPAPADGEVRTTSQRRADALSDLILGDAGGKANVEVHVDRARLHSDRGMAETSDRQVLSDSELATLLCDCRVGRIVFGPASEPIDVGRAMRLVGGPLRRALVARDRRCRFPGCDRPHRWCDAHHLVSWAAGGRTAIDNLVLLCRHHHTLIHSDRWQLRGTPNDLIAERHDGYRMVSRPPP